MYNGCHLFDVSPYMYLLIVLLTMIDETRYVFTLLRRRRCMLFMRQISATTVSFQVLHFNTSFVGMFSSICDYFEVTGVIALCSCHLLWCQW